MSCSVVSRVFKVITYCPMKKRYCQGIALQLQLFDLLLLECWLLNGPNQQKSSQNFVGCCQGVAMWLFF